MDKKLKVSIAMTTFNGAEFLRPQLISFSNQVSPPDELIVCDDGSTDDTLIVLEEFKQSALFDVIIIQNDHNLGFTKNFEKALSNCSGDIIFLSDQDDIWFSNKIGVVEKTFHDNPGIFLLIHDGELVDENLISQGVTKFSQVMSGHGSDAWFITGALTAIRRDFLSLALPIPTGIVGHDGWFHYIARIMENRLILDINLELIRRHSSNTSESIASSLKRINRYTFVREQYSKAPSDSYQNRLLYNLSLTDRIDLMSNIESSCESLSQSKAMRNLKSERSSIINRENLIQLGFFKRKITALRMLILGDYQYFNGINSFIRDFLR